MNGKRYLSYIYIKKQLFIEDWILFKTCTKPLYREYYISNKGNIRMKTPISDEILTLENGLSYLQIYL